MSELKLREQLDAEREAWASDLLDCQNRLRDKAQQLATEREKREAQGLAYERLKKDHQSQLDKLLDTCEQLREQLAAERKRKDAEYQKGKQDGVREHYVGK